MARENLGRTDPREKRAHEQLLAFIEDYHLADHDASIAGALRALRQDNDSRLNQHLFRTVCDRCARYIAFHREYPFITAPRHVLHAGNTPILSQFADHSPISFSPGEAARGLIVIGSTGSGKTAILLRIADANLATSQEWIVDAKDDARALAARHPHLLAITPEAPVDLLARPAYLSVSEHIALLTESFARTMYVGQTGKAVLHEAITNVFERDRPTLQQLLATVEGLIRKGDSFDRINAIRNIALRIRRLLGKFTGLAATSAVPLFKLCEQSVLWSFTAYTDLEDLIVTTAVLHLFHHHRAHNLREHTTTIHVDEALLAFREENGRHINGNLLAELVGLTREFGIAWRLSVNTGSLLDPSVLANTFAIIALNVNSGSEAQAITRTLGLSPEQAEYHARKLTRGQAILRMGDRWRYPVLCTYDDLPFPKTITTDAWTAATQRIKELAAREESTGRQPTPTTQSASASPPATLAPVVEKTSPNKGKVALNKHDAALLAFAAEHPLTPTTAAYDYLGIHWTQGDRSKQRLLRLELLTAHRVIIRPGRGGTASVLRLTPAGWTWLGTTGPKGLRGGGSVQHEYLTRALAAAIPHSSIEEQLGEKSVDLAVPFNTARDRDFVQRVIACSALAAAPSLQDGDILGIEVDLQQTTALNNVTKNTTALTIIATMPAETERITVRLRLNLTLPQLAHVIVINVFDLLAIAREFYERTT